MRTFTICDQTFTIEKVTEFNQRIWEETHDIFLMVRRSRSVTTPMLTGYVASWQHYHHWARSQKQAFKRLLKCLGWTLVKTPNSCFLMKEGME